MPTIIYERHGQKIIRLTQCRCCDMPILLPTRPGKPPTRCAVCKKKKVKHG